MRFLNNGKIKFMSKRVIRPNPLALFIFIGALVALLVYYLASSIEGF